MKRESMVKELRNAGKESKKIVIALILLKLKSALFFVKGEEIGLTNVKPFHGREGSPPVSPI